MNRAVQDVIDTFLKICMTYIYTKRVAFAALFLLEAIMRMGMQFGLEGNGTFCKRQFRWIFNIPQVCGNDSPGANTLPPEKSARPSLTFKEMDAKHLVEDIYFPAKPEWKPINITLYDLQRDRHPVFKWIEEIYTPETGRFRAPKDGQFIKQCSLNMLDATGNIIESWIFEDAWPQSANFQTLDMGNSGIATCDLTLRYARAYITYG